MFKVLLSVFILGIFPAFAMDPSEEEDHSGRYFLHQENNEGGVVGNATVIEIGDSDNCLVLTSAHCVQPSKSPPRIITGEARFDDGMFKRHEYTAIENISIHPSYKGTPQKQEAKNDIALGVVKKNSNLICFKNKISFDMPDKNKRYWVKIKSFGPNFSADESSYSQSSFHEFYVEVKYDEKDGYFYHPFESRKFYLSFESIGNDKFALNGGLLSALANYKGNLLPGDSGSLVVDVANEKAIALASCVENNPEKLLESVKLGEEFSKIEKIDEKTKSSLVQKIQEEIANCTKIFPNGSSEKGIYLFELKEGLPPIKGVDYFTPLALHSKFIEEYAEENMNLSIKESKKFRVVFDANTGHAEDPDAINTLLTLGDRLDKLKKKTKELGDGLNEKDRTLVAGIFRGFVNSCTGRGDQSSSEEDLN